MKKLIFITLLLGSMLNFDTDWFQLFQADYFVDNVNGSDSNSGRYPWEAWQTFDSINSATFSFVAGDRIGLSSGKKFTGTITPGQSGTAGNNIVIKSYGTGDKPIIYGSVALTGWTQRGSSNIYVKFYDADTIFQLTVNDERMTEARYPNSGYDYIDTVKTTSSFVCNSLNTAIDYTGTKWVGRTEQYKTPTYTVTVSSSKTLTLSSVPDGGLTANTEGFILVGSLALLDTVNEWYYNPANDTCYFWAEGNVDPDTFTEVRGSITDYGVNINSKNYITVKNIEFRDQKLAGINLYNTDYITIDNNEFYNQDAKAIYASGSSPASYLTVTNNTVKYSNHFGMELFTSNSTIQDNSIDSTAIFTNLGGSGMGASYAGSGMYVQGNDNLIKYNRVLNSGYNGIHFEYRNTVSYNYVYNSNLSKDDGGAIYTSSGDTYPNSRANNSVVSFNIIDGSYGTFNGFTTYTYTYGEGIYIDQWAGYVDVLNNVVANTTGNALYSHYGYNNDIQNNITYRNKHGIFLKRDGRATNVKHNDIYGFSRDYNDDQSERMAWAYLLTGTPTIDSNRYVNHYKTDLFAYNSTTVTFTNWKDSMNMDDNSVLDVAALTTNYTENLLYNDTKVTKTFYLNNATNITDAFSNASITSSFTLAEFTGKVIEGLNPDCVLDYADSIAPLITSFTIPTTGDLTISITTFTTTGDATEYKLTESATTPTLESTGWSSTVPTTYTFSGAGAKTLYAWARDAAGNISNYASDTSTITIDLTAGLIAAYDMEVNGTVLVDEHTNNLDGVNKDSGGTDRNVTAVAGLPGNGYPYISTGLRQSNIADNALLDFTGAFSIGAWVNITTFAGNRTIVAKNAEFALIVTTAGVLQMRVYENGGANYVTIVTASGTIQDSTNYFIEVKADGTNAREGYDLFVNGVAQSVTYGGDIGNLTIGIADTANDLNIGYFSTLSASMFGTISQVVIYDSYIVQGFSDALYNSGSGVSYTGF